jgi:hypothetical protein
MIYGFTIGTNTCKYPTEKNKMQIELLTGLAANVKNPARYAGLGYSGMPSICKTVWMGIWLLALTALGDIPCE